MRAVPAIGESGYARLADDAYRTPAWVTEALLGAVDLRGSVWEPAAGEGDMVEVLERGGRFVFATDIRASNFRTSVDFLAPNSHWAISARPDSIVTNPPYALADAFIRRALDLTETVRGMVAMLLPHEFDCAASRADLFARHPAFACKLILTRRIRWVGFDDRASPRNNHAWLIWDWRKHDLAPPVLRWSA